MIPSWKVTCPVRTSSMILLVHGVSLGGRVAPTHGQAPAHSLLPPDGLRTSAIGKGLSARVLLDGLLDDGLAAAALELHAAGPVVGCDLRVAVHVVAGDIPMAAGTLGRSAGPGRRPPAA